MTDLAKMLVENNTVKVPLGTLLLVDDLILPQDLEMALQHQKHTRQLLGEILVKIGALKNDDLEAALCLQRQCQL